MYKWFSEAKNRLIYLGVIITVHVVIVLMGWWEFMYVEERRSLLPQNIDIYPIIWPTLWLLYVYLVTFLGLLFLVFAIYRMIRKQPSKVYWWLGGLTIVLHIVFLFSLAMLNR